jgi:hypothetical protein
MSSSKFLLELGGLPITPQKIVTRSIVPHKLYSFLLADIICQGPHVSVKNGDVVFCIFTSKWAFVFFMFYTNDTMPLPL